MGMYLNPGNIGFQRIRNDIYVDKTGLISYVNGTINTARCFTCVSRPRRFGKSFAAKMLCAYYDRSCDSEEIFQGLEISRSASFHRYLNQFDVIYLDITGFLSRSGADDQLVETIQQCVIREMREDYPDCVDENEKYLDRALFSVTRKTGHRFFVIIDEWDALFREKRQNEKLLQSYLCFLRGLFKGGPVTDRTIAGAYMTGILPIKKYGTESALTDFREYTMTEPDALAEYVGFTEEEVLALCREYERDFDEMKKWYDGYSFLNFPSVYSPDSVMSAITRGHFRNYWTQTESYESLKRYIAMNLDGLKEAVIEMLGGQSIPVSTLSFQNDLTSMKSRDDILTLLIHLGYLSYDEEKGRALIPNLEVADSFKLAVQDREWGRVGEALWESEELLKATIRGDEDRVAVALEQIHESVSSILQYNNEDSLASAIVIAYYTARRDYTIIRELPSGKGFADLTFIPRRNVEKPALIVELKYDQSADSAISQIREKRYCGALEDFTGNLLLVGINYDRKTKTHRCFIEKREPFSPFPFPTVSQ